MPLREDILNPIEGDNPSGENLYYDPVYEKIKEARRYEDAGPQGAWEREIKVADYGEVIRLAEETLATRTKDLQLAAWLGEALIYEEGVSGLSEALDLMRQLVEQFWDTLYPELDEGDAEFRAAPLEWFANYFDPSKGSSPALALRRIPLTETGLDLFQYRESRSVPTEAEAGADENKAKARKAAAADGKTTPEEFEEAFKSTSKVFLRKLEADFEGLGPAMEAFAKVCDEKFGDIAPGYRELRKAIEEVATAARILLQEKLKVDPDPVPVEEGEEEGVEEELGLEGIGEEGEEAGEPSGGLALKSRKDAVRLVVASAKYMRRATPNDPIPYLVVRALRWGELRSETGEIEAGLLEAPAAEVRIALKNAGAAGDWGKVLEVAETAAATGCGRGWLDLHRYTICACDELGHVAAARALRSTLKALLTDLPKLPTLTLADDTGTANPETLSWLIQESLYDPSWAGR